MYSLMNYFIIDEHLYLSCYNEPFIGFIWVRYLTFSMTQTDAHIYISHLNTPNKAKDSFVYFPNKLEIKNIQDFLLICIWNAFVHCVNQFNNFPVHLQIINNKWFACYKCFRMRVTKIFHKLTMILIDGHRAIELLGSNCNIFPRYILNNST